MEKIAIASDHAGVELKDCLKTFLKENGMIVMDMGINSTESVDYPDYGIPVAQKISKGELEKGILICGTGIGMSIVANKFANVRAALVSDAYSASMAKKHNNANILVIAGRNADKELAKEMVKAWLGEKFEGGRHQRRLDKIKEIEKNRI